MSSEKMAILNMLEQGKITADNAAKLLAALGESDNIKKESDTVEGRAFGSQTKTPESAFDVKKWATDLGKRIEVVTKDLEPKIQKIAGTVAQKSMEFADATSKTIQTQRTAHAEKSTHAPKATAKTPAPHSAASYAKSENESTFELTVTADIANEIILRSPNGHVNIKGYNGDKATVKVSYKKNGAGRDIEFLKSGGVYQLNYNMDEFETVNIDAYIPYAMFGHLRVETANSIVTVDNVNAKNIEINTSKCHISVKNIVSYDFKIDNMDGSVLLSNLSGELITVDNANAGIDATNTDFKTLKFDTTGEPVTVVTQGFYKYNDYKWSVRTSNAKLKVILPVSSDTGYDIKAHTSFSDVTNSLPNISYVRNDRNFIEGKSANYNVAYKKIKIELDTTNAPLYVN